MFAGDYDCVQVLLLIARLLAKSELVVQQIRDKVSVFAYKMYCHQDITIWRKSIFSKYNDLLAK